jgi:two-component system sensor histidine kinase MprB
MSFRSKALSFRSRLTIAVAVAVAIAVALGAVAAYFAARNELVGQVDAGLYDAAEQIRQTPPDHLLGFRGGFGGAYYQVVTSGGQTQLPPTEGTPIPVSAATKAVAAGKHRPFYAGGVAAGLPIRVYTFQYAPGFAVQVVSRVSEIDQALARLRWVLVLVGAGGVGLAALLGLLVTRAVLSPVRRLTEATEHVAATRDLSERIDATRQDELGRLASSFNTMLSALEDSVVAQRQLVADASHELRTPLTSLRTNIEVLARADALPPDERERLLADVVEQLAEMTALVSELVELARGQRVDEEPEPLRLDLLVEDAVERAQRNYPGVLFVTHLADTQIEGVPSRIERAVGNLLDNAAKWSPGGGTVEVSVRDGRAGCRAPGSGSRSSSRWRTPTAARSAPSVRPEAAPSCGCS